MKHKLPGIACGAVLSVILALGLWPFQAPQNDVSWLGSRAGLRFGRYGTAISSGVFHAKTSPNKKPSCSLEIRLQPRRKWGKGTFLAFHTPENPLQFSLQQSQTDLLLETESVVGKWRRSKSRFYVDNVFRSTEALLVTIASGTDGTAVYVNGSLLRTIPQLRLYSEHFSGRIVLGDSPWQGNNWSGELYGLAIYDQELSPQSVLEHFERWRQSGNPGRGYVEGQRALYLFDERSGAIVHDWTGSGVNFYIPRRYMVLNQAFLERPWDEFSMSKSYWSAVLKNVVGFIPFGFVFYPYLAIICRLRRAALATVALGTLVSLTIEVLQAYLPTRDSGMTDLFTNTFGAYVGVAAFRVLSVLILRNENERSALLSTASHALVNSKRVFNGDQIAKPKEARGLCAPAEPVRRSRFC